VVLTRQTYNTQDKHKKPKDKHKKQQKLNQNHTNPGLVASYGIWPENGSGLF